MLLLGANVCSACFVCALCLCVTGLYEMKKGWHGFAQGGGGCTMKTEPRLSLGLLFTFCCNGPREKASGGVMLNESSAQYTQLALLESNSFSSGLY